VNIKKYVFLIVSCFICFSSYCVVRDIGRPINYVIILEEDRSEVEKIEEYNQKLKEYNEQKEGANVERPRLDDYTRAMFQTFDKATDDSIDIIIVSPQILEAMLTQDEEGFFDYFKKNWNIYKSPGESFAILVSKELLKDYRNLYRQKFRLIDFGLNNNLVEVSTDELEATFYNKEFDQINIDSLINIFSDQVLPLKFIYLTGHGSKGRIAQLPLGQYARFIREMNKRACTFFVVDSCFAGGENLAKAHKKVIIRDSIDILTKENIHFPIAVNSLSDATVKVIDSNFAAFFNGLRNLFALRKKAGVKTWITDPFKSILKNISGDLLENLPSIKFPGVPGFFRVVDVDNDVAIITEPYLVTEELKQRFAFAPIYGKGKELKVVTGKRKPFQLKPTLETEVKMLPLPSEIRQGPLKYLNFLVSHKRALLLYPAVIGLPIRLLGGIPKLVSMIPGNAQHYLEGMHVIDGEDLVENGFKGFEKIIKGMFGGPIIFSSKLFFIKKLSVEIEKESEGKDGKVSQVIDNVYIRTFFKESDGHSKDLLQLFGGFIFDNEFYSFYYIHEEGKEESEFDVKKSSMHEYFPFLIAHIINTTPSKNFLLESFNSVDSDFKVRAAIADAYRVSGLGYMIEGLGQKGWDIEKGVFASVSKQGSDYKNMPHMILSRPDSNLFDLYLSKVTDVLLKLKGKIEFATLLDLKRNLYKPKAFLNDSIYKVGEKIKIDIYNVGLFSVAKMLPRDDGFTLLPAEKGRKYLGGIAKILPDKTFQVEVEDCGRLEVGGCLIICHVFHKNKDIISGLIREGDKVVITIFPANPTRGVIVKAEGAEKLLKDINSIFNDMFKALRVVADSYEPRGVFTDDYHVYPYYISRVMRRVNPVLKIKDFTMDSNRRREIYDKLKRFEEHVAKAVQEYAEMRGRIDNLERQIKKVLTYVVKNFVRKDQVLDFEKQVKIRMTSLDPEDRVGRIVLLKKLDLASYIKEDLNRKAAHKLFDHLRKYNQQLYKTGKRYRKIRKDIDKIKPRVEAYKKEIGQYYQSTKEKSKSWLGGIFG